MPGGNVVIEGDSIVSMSRDDPGLADTTIDATGKLVSPGFINCHVRDEDEVIPQTFPVLA